MESSYSGTTYPRIVSLISGTGENSFNEGICLHVHYSACCVNIKCLTQSIPEMRLGQNNIFTSLLGEIAMFVLKKMRFLDMLKSQDLWKVNIAMGEFCGGPNLYLWYCRKNILKLIVEEFRFTSPTTTITTSNLECVISSARKYCVYSQ